MRMRYSPIFDWSKLKFWTNFSLWFILNSFIFYLGIFIKEKYDNWIYYIGWILIFVSLFLILTNLTSIYNRYVWQKNKNDPDYIAKYDPSTFTSEYYIKRITESKEKEFNKKLDDT